MRSLYKKIFFVIGIILIIAAAARAISIAKVEHRRAVLRDKKNKVAADIEKEIRGAAAGWDGRVSVFIKDLSSPYLAVSINENDRFAAASLIKVPIMAAVFTGVQEKRFSLDTLMVVGRNNITGGSGTIKTMKLPVNLTIEELLKLMISCSDNTATNRLIDLMGYDYIAMVFSRLGLKNTVLKRKMMDFSLRAKGVENYISSYDVAFVLEKIYNKELVNEEFSLTALSFLREQEINDRLPRYLPQSVSVAHKTGLERGIVHDAGIVFSPKGDYIICVLLDKVTNYNKAKKLIADISLAVYNLYQ